MKTLVLNKDNSACSFGPKRQRKILIIALAASQNVLFFLSANPFIWEFVRHCQLPLNPISSAEIIILVGVNLFSITEICLPVSIQDFKLLKDLF
jgi:hypothetical protein